ncbi:MAG: alpha/beta fold hydrolase, partial [Actinobacteria bacterium]|nr:alpha/beta fold hydrolase [Actinomycetota bacterium]
MTLHASSSDSVELAIHDLGGEGPPLLFVHATGFHGRCYTRIAEQLGDIRRCWAPDLRAHGDSTIPADDRFHWSGMADDLCAVLDALGIDEPVDFVGHSM